jgi:hypothetical protein
MKMTDTNVVTTKELATFKADAFKAGKSAASALETLRVIFAALAGQTSAIIAEVRYEARLGYVIGLAAKRGETLSRKSAVEILEKSNPDAKNDKPKRTEAEQADYIAAGVAIFRASDHVKLNTPKKSKGQGRKAGKGAGKRKDETAPVAPIVAAPIPKSANFVDYLAHQMNLLNQVSRYAKENAALSSQGGDIGAKLRGLVANIDKQAAAIVILVKAEVETAAA